MESHIELQYYLATKIYGSFKDDVPFAAIEPPLAYSLFAADWRQKREQAPQTYWWQGLTMGRLEGMLDVITAPVGRGRERVLSFGEFEKLYTDMFDDENEFRRKSVAAAANALHRFQPPDRPIFWRMLIAQARLYQALLRTRTAGNVPTGQAEWLDLLRLDDQDDFRWRAGSGGVRSLRRP